MPSNRWSYITCIYTCTHMIASVYIFQLYKHILYLYISECLFVPHYGNNKYPF